MGYHSMELLTLLTVCLLLVWPGVLLAEPLKASFYGDSFLRVPIEDASSETTIRLAFRTYQSDALLLLAGGSTDFCLIEIQRGQVRMRIDLGSGEATLGSPPGLLFNDMGWHDVAITHSGSSVTMVMDDIYSVATTTPGSFHELNINQGLYFGNIGAFPDVFYGHFEEFRGCLKDVVYNDVDILYETKIRNDPVNVFGVTWNCSEEFVATSEQPISFLANTSFVAFPSLTLQHGLVRITLEVKTRSDKALVLYNSGRLESHDFISLEIVNSVMKLTLNKGNGLVQLSHKRVVNDGNWHQIEVVIDSVDIKLSVDGHRKEKRSNFGENRYLDLHGYLFVGGISVFARAKTIRMGTTSVSGHSVATESLVGCMQNIKINGRSLGFREAKVTHQLRPECVWTFPCSSNPCVNGATCEEEGLYHYKCQCEGEVCYERGATGVNLATPRTEVIYVQDLVVREGGRALVSASNIVLLVNYTDYGIRDSQVQYSIVQSPQFGEVSISTGTSAAAEKSTFTQLDLVNDKVYYTHDGGENSQDEIGFELQFLDPSERAPAKLRKTYGFTLVVKVAEWNDQPVLSLPRDGAIVMVINTEVPITRKILSAVDDDDPDSELEYTVQYPPGYDIGYFEISDSLGVRARITAFSQQDVDDGNIKFVHRGGRQQTLRVQVSDGKDVTEPQILSIAAVPLRLSLAANTGLSIVAGETALVTNHNLSYATNAPNQDIDIRYTVTDPPYHGELQRQQFGDNTWVVSSVFTQTDIDQFRLRYVNYPNLSSVQDDYFSYKVSAMGVTSEQYQFMIAIKSINVELRKSRDLVLDGVRQQVITPRHLSAVSSVPDHGADAILYKLRAAPMFGNLYLKAADAGRKRRRRQKLDSGDHFSQQDVDSNNVMYKLHRAGAEPIHDHFKFVLMIPGAVSPEYSYDIRYHPKDGGEEEDVSFVNNMLMGVVEGGQKVITKNDLYMETEDHKEFSYSLQSGPMHGKLHLLDPQSKEVSEEPINRFTNDDIRRELLVYVHDDSENKQDHFDFSALPIIDTTGGDITQDISEFSGTFDIEIDLTNDNPPERVVERVFDVVAGGGRTITEHDIEYTDPDMDFDSGLLQYTRREIPNGDVVYTENRTTSVYQWTQQELRDGRIYFRHQGANYGRAVLWVTDGHFFSSGLLEIRATDPYLRLESSSHEIAMASGESVPLASLNITLETNLNVDPESAVLTVKRPPRNGQVQKHGEQVGAFKFSELASGAIVYTHGGGNNQADKFDIMIEHDGHEDTAEIMVKVSHAISGGGDDKVGDLPLHMEPLVINEREKAAITKDNLHFKDQNVPAREVVYSIVQYPSHGALSVRGRERVNYFTQEDVNKRKVLYSHQNVDDDRDVLRFDVTNGEITLNNVEFVIEIIPDVIHMRVADFTVKEGESACITKDTVTIVSRHFLQKRVDYVLVEEAVNGWIEDRDNPGVPLVQFTHTQVENEQIYYVNNGNDSRSDAFTVMAKSLLNKQSHPHTVHITVLPVNDEPPKVTVNIPLEVWSGSTTVITSAHLSAADADSGPEDVVYVITSPDNGYVARTDDPKTNVVRFTQRDIDDGNIAFVHTGGSAGSLEFQVNDGVNYDRRRVFAVAAKPLVLTLTTHTLLSVFPHTRQPITARHLAAQTNDPQQSQHVSYTLQSKPKHGILLKQDETGTMLEVTSFLQRDIDDERIVYKHLSPTEGWTQYDSFIFEVSTPYADSIKFKMFEITVSYENVNADNVGQLVTLRPLTVEEGGEVTVTANHLDAYMLAEKLAASPFNVHIYFKILQVPLNGTLFINGKNASDEDLFLQKDVNGGRVVYVHDHSDYDWDAFYFTVEMAYNYGGTEVRTQAKFVGAVNITILPINDQPFVLLTRYPYIELVQGFTAIITPDILNTFDPDTKPKHITYEIANGPTNGYIAFKNNDLAITSFTQQDINDGIVQFIQDGSLESGAFYFRVSDGQFKPYYKVFNIRVHPLTLQLDGVTDISILQGHFSAVLNEDTFRINTNGVRETIMYNITKAPLHGHLYMRNNPVKQFAQKDIDAHQVTYIQTDLEASSDRFEFILFDKQNIIMTNSIDVVVVANVEKPSGPVRLDATSLEPAITLAMLDASRLAALTASNPVYVVSAPPRHAKIVKLVSPRELVDETGAARRRREVSKAAEDDEKPMKMPVNRFTHNDIVKKKIQLSIESANITEELFDSFKYTLKAKNAQPVNDVFEFVIAPQIALTPGPSGGDVKDESKVAMTTLKPADSEEEADAGESQEDAKAASNNLVIVYSVAGITAFVILCIIVMKCCRKKNKKDEEVKYQSPQMASANADMANVEVLSAAKDNDAALYDPAAAAPPHSPPRGRARSLSPSPPDPHPPAYTHLSKSQPLHEPDYHTLPPTCKVTPLGGGDGGLPPPPPEMLSDTSPPDYSHQKADPGLYDWGSVDPQLLQHCRTTNPVLNDNKYWV